MTEARPGSPATLAAVLRERVERGPDELACRFVTDADDGGAWTYRGLDRYARALAVRLRREGLNGKPVLLAHPPGLDYVGGFLGCQYAGAVAVPAYPADTARSGHALRRLAAMAADCAATHALTTADVLPRKGNRDAGTGAAGPGALRWLVAEETDAALAEHWDDPGTGRDSLAFLQYTSGSTSAPKGVMVSNENVLHNLESIHRRLGHDENSAIVSWLPLYHDLGLIGCFLTALYGGVPLHFLSPLAFARRPMLWLETLSATGATTSGGPNFGYEHCLRKITEQQRDTLDLSRWRIAVNGAEPIRSGTLDRFAEFFAPCGFDRRAFSPCYGLAEATLMVTATASAAKPVQRTFDAVTVAEGNPAPPTSRTSRTVRLVGCGPAADGVAVAVVDPETGRRLPSGRVGEIWVAGPSVARGYWGKDEESERTFRAAVADEPGVSFLRTGDLGFQHRGELFVVGRAKDVMVVQGTNHYPQDIELTVENAAGAPRANSVTAFSAEIDGSEQLVVALEAAVRPGEDTDSLLAKVRSGIGAEHAVSPHAVVVLRPGALPKTTSGKLRRQACSRAFRTFGLAVAAASVTRASAPKADAAPPSAAAVLRALADISGRTDVEGRGFAELGLEYPRLVELVRKIEARWGIAVPIGPLLVDPRADTLVALCRRQPRRGSPTPAELQHWLRARLGDQLGLPPSAIDPALPLAEIGAGSQHLVALVDELGSWLGREVTPATVFDYPTIRELSQRFGRPAPAPPLSPAADPRAGEPIAIVGIGCRLPGAVDARSYWKLLLDGRDAVTEVPAGRWDADAFPAPGFGGFIDGADQFDAQFFGISAREAQQMDPQQRLLLEIAWQCVEDAGIAPTSLAGSDAGVFVGISSNDYATLRSAGHDEPDLYTATGNAHAIAANRLSYLLDLRGPSLALDTACSSSLVAVHLACRSLRERECGLALAGGVNLMLSPLPSVAFAQGRMLAAQGRCRVFDDAADGYVRGEGAGLVCLKLLSDATAAGDRVYATISGSAVAHGGRANGLTAPSGIAQRQVIQRALEKAGLCAEEIDYVEAHGTATKLGDLVEWETLAAVYGTGRADDKPCLVGSVKANIGHLEAAAGVAGLIKAALVVHHGEVPPQLHLETPSTRLAWADSGLTVSTRRTELLKRGAARAAVSSFGFGGANAHVVLEQAPRGEPAGTAPERAAHVLCLSGHTPTALRTLAGDYRRHLAANPEAGLDDLCRAANTGRALLRYRGAAVGAGAKQLDAALAALAADTPSAAVARDVDRGERRRVAFVFSGQGSHYAGMGRELYEGHPSFRDTIDQAGLVLRPLLDRPLPELLLAGQSEDWLTRTRYCQPALVALEVALARLWISLGVRPAAVLGHSVGAYSAACISGAVQFDDVLALVALRARYMEEHSAGGEMIACVGDAEVVRAVALRQPGIAVAAVNAPDHLVLAGPPAPIASARRELEASAVDVRSLRVSHAFHSPMMAGAAPPLRDAAKEVDFAAPATPWISDLTGEPVGGVDENYWADHVLSPVLFADGFAALRRLGCDAFAEIGPNQTLLTLGRAMTADPAEALWLPSLRPGREWETLLRSLGRLHCSDGSVDWAALDRHRTRVPVDVPHSVREPRSCWFTAAATGSAEGETREAPAGRDPATAIPVLTRRRLLHHLARVSGFAPDQIPSHARLGADLGFDSLMVTELRRHFGPLPERQAERVRQALAEDPTVAQLTELLEAGEGEPEALEPAEVRERTGFEQWPEYLALRQRRRQVERGGANPYDRVHDGGNSGHATIDGKRTVNFSAFNYLALSHHRRVREAAKAAVDRYGTSASATPLLCGQTPLHKELAAEIAGFLGTEDAMVFAGGHSANVATVGHLFGPPDLVLHDRWIHDSIVRGCVLSGAQRQPFPHNDWASLDERLRAARDRHRRTLIVLEGAYSQDGDIPDLPRFVEVAKRHGAMLMVDEAHSIGVLGATGAGIGEHFGVDRADVDLWMGTLSKALGSLGGYLAGRAPVIEYLEYTAPLYIFSTGISPANAGAALEAIRVVKEEPERVARVRELADLFRTAARARGLDIGVSRASAVIPVVIGEWEPAIAVSNALLAMGVNAMPIGYPAVERDQCRLRFFVNADHAEDDIEYSLDRLVEAMRAAGVRP
ncbi:aminotransferase class I/II-fold pyridoxal phosphate-dependent enzyme [Amycolatopsis sp. FU40]|uniref:type I polyketide synthase n=1 Tax=Amycolatopsis sp. FU40 TaxID=2914159 RepID=UPI001F023955|nr:type I polyketide synthase [Amycolatopsis sp. FU40]UKD58661.1 aminotransferase class I/II-fold pyridoxal phosphate-dependent enzyme [Amycolatopsis sp. FU40]